MNRLICVLLIIAVFVVAVVTPAMAIDKKCAFRIEGDRLPTGRSPGEVVVGAHGGGVEVVHASGLAHLELRVEITPGNIFRIASLTKQFTAVAVLALMEDGLASLDDPLAVHFADAPRHWRSITLLQLLSHTSGLTADMTPVLRHMKEDMEPEELIGLFADTPLSSQPGTAWRYSNLNYWILGLVIENITDRPYADYIRDRLLHPARMVRTRYGNHRDIIRGRVAGYEIDQEGCVRNARYFSSSIGFAAGGFVSTPIEMARWYDALSRGRILSPEFVRLALTPVKTKDGAATGYGLGWYVDETGGHPVAHHGGTSIGYSSYVYWSPAMNVFTGVFRNWSDDEGEPRKRAREIYDRLRRDPTP